MAILFDLDGTLVNTSPDFLAAANRLLDEVNLPHVSIDKINHMASEGVEMMVKGILNYTPSEEQLHELKDKFLSYYAATNFAFANLFSGMSEILSLLDSNGVAWGVVTNKPQQFGKPLLEKLNLLQRSRVTIFGDSLASGLKKPHPEPLLVACEHMQINPTHCIYIGDHLRDIQAGNDAGMTTISALFGYIDDLTAATKWPADVMVYSVNELHDYISNWLLTSKGMPKCQP